MKRGNMESVIIKFLFVGASITLTCVLISIGVINFRQGRELANSTANKIERFNNAIIESDITQYDGMTVKGSDVVNFYKKHLGGIADGLESGFSITIKTVNGINTYNDGTYLGDIRNNADGKYVKPTGKFACSVEKNTNGVITKVIFEQI